MTVESSFIAIVTKSGEIKIERHMIVDIQHSWLNHGYACQKTAVFKPRIHSHNTLFSTRVKKNASAGTNILHFESIL